MGLIIIFMGSEKVHSGVESPVDVRALQTELFESRELKEALKGLFVHGPLEAAGAAFMAGPFKNTVYFQKYGATGENLNFAIDGDVGPTTLLAQVYCEFHKAREEVQSELQVVENTVINSESGKPFKLDKKVFRPTLDKTELFQAKAITPTLRIAAKPGPNYLKPEYMQRLEGELSLLGANPENQKLSLSEFDQLCTEARKLLSQEQLINMTGDELYEQYIVRQEFTALRKILGREMGKIDPPEPQSYLDQYQSNYDLAAARYGVPVDLILSIHYHESQFDGLAVSTGHCYGVGQLSGYWYAEKKGGKGNPTGYTNINPFNVPDNIDRSGEGIGKLYARFAGHPEPRRSELAMIAYCSDGIEVANKYAAEGLETSTHWYVEKTNDEFASLKQRLVTLQQKTAPEERAVLNS